MAMLSHGQLLGTHIASHDSGATIQDLLDLLKKIPAQARQNYVMVVCDGCARDVTGIQFSQSDQAEKWDFKVYLRTEGE